MQKPNGRPLGETLKTYGPSQTSLKYSSASTRSSSLQGFMGGAEFNEVWRGPLPIPTDVKEDLKAKFNSFGHEKDLPTCYGPSRTTNVIAWKGFDVDAEVESWMRNKGEKIKKA